MWTFVHSTHSKVTFAISRPLSASLGWDLFFSYSKGVREWKKEFHTRQRHARVTWGLENVYIFINNFRLPLSSLWRKKQHLLLLVQRSSLNSEIFFLLFFCGENPDKRILSSTMTGFATSSPNPVLTLLFVILSSLYVVNFLVRMWEPAAAVSSFHSLNPVNACGCCTFHV